MMNCADNVKTESTDGCKNVPDTTMVDELAQFKPTAADNKRVFVISVFYLLVAVFIGVPVWLKTTATYQAPLPFWDIKSLCSRPIEIRVPVNIISFSTKFSAEDLIGIQNDLRSSNDPSLRCGSLPQSSYKLQLNCDLRARLATSSESISYTRLISANKTFENLLDAFTAEWFDTCLLNEDLSSETIPNDRPCLTDPSGYTVVILPEELRTIFRIFEPTVNVIQRSAQRNLVFILEPSYSTTHADGRRKTTSQIAAVMNDAFLPIADLEQLVSPSSVPASSGEHQRLTYSRGSSKAGSYKTRQLPASTDYDVIVTIMTHSGDSPDHSSPGLKGKNQTYQLLDDPTPWMQSQIEEVFTSWLPHVRFHFSSQRLHAVDIEQLSQSRLNDERTYRYYSRDDLSTIVNQLESFLGAPQTASAATRDMAGTKPGLHLIFLLAMPFKSTMSDTDSVSSCPLPLMFRLPSASGESMLTHVAVVPQWGGFFSVGAPSPCTDSGLDMTQLKYQVITVIQSLLGMTGPKQTTFRFNPDIVQNEHFGTIDHWQLDSWFLRRTVESLLSIRMTMTALVNLLSRFPNMVVNDYVASEVTRSITIWEQTLDDLRTGRNLSMDGGFGGVFTRAQDSLSSIDSAFFDHTLLGRLYFQEDQKFGIYVPLFVPVGVGLLLSTRNALRILFPKEPTP